MMMMVLMIEIMMMVLVVFYINDVDSGSDSDNGVIKIFYDDYDDIDYAQLLMWAVIS